MATFRQIQANRLNALRSTGPVTDEGKARSRQNGLVHGLAGEGVVLGRGDEAVVAERLVAWRAGYELATPEDEWTFEQLVVHSVRLDACRAREAALQDYEAARAAVAWDDDRRAAAEAMGARLSTSPGQVAGRLEATAAGCRWLLGRWDDLSRSQEWSDVQKSLAFDLLGIPPDPRDGDPWALAGCESPDALVESQRDRLAAKLAEGLDDLDAVERSLTEQGIPARLSPEMSRLRRYEAACLRRYEEARARLTRRVPSPAPAPEPAPPPAPEPEPIPSPAPRVSSSRPRINPNSRMTDDDWREYERAIYMKMMTGIEDLP